MLRNASRSLVRLLSICAILPSAANAQAYWHESIVEFDPGFGTTRLYAADFSQDGVADLLSDDIEWYWNQEGTGKTWLGYFVNHFYFQDAIDVADVDGDGDQDFFATYTAEDLLRWWEKDDLLGWQEHTIATGLSNATGLQALAAADFDGDGSVDVIAEGSLAWVAYLNTSGDGSTWVPLIVQQERRAQSFDSGDLNLDGAVDLYAANASRLPTAASWYANAPSPSGWSETVIDFGGPLQSGFLSDLDVDGDLDAVSVRPLPEGIEWFDNAAGDASSWEPHPIPLPAHYDYPRCTEAADIDADGDPDLVGVAYLGPAVFWLESGAGWAAHEVVDPSGISLPDAAITADFDGDCDLDIAAIVSNVLGTEGRIVWYENQLPIASETVRLGTPPNPNALQPGASGPPLLGQVWSPSVDAAAFPGATQVFLAVGFQPANVPSPVGTILVDLEVHVTLFAAHLGQPFNVPMPASCELLGLRLFTQGAAVEGVAVQLTNALDLVVGT